MHRRPPTLPTYATIALETILQCHVDCRAPRHARTNATALRMLRKSVVRPLLEAARVLRGNLKNARRSSSPAPLVLGTDERGLFVYVQYYKRGRASGQRHETIAAASALRSTSDRLLYILAYTPGIYKRRCRAGPAGWLARFR